MGIKLPLIMNSDVWNCINDELSYKTKFIHENVHCSEGRRLKSDL